MATDRFRTVRALIACALLAVTTAGTAHASVWGADYFPNVELTCRESMSPLADLGAHRLTQAEGVADQRIARR